MFQTISLHRSENGNFNKVIAIIEAVKAKNSSANHLLPISLLHAAEGSNILVTNYFLTNDAGPNSASENRGFPLLRGIKANRVKVARL